MLSKIDNILETIDKNEIGLENIDAASKEVVEILRDKKIVVYPAGTNGKLIQDALLSHGIKIAYFADKSYESLKSIKEAPVYDSSALADITDDYVVVISANLRTQYEFFQRLVREINPKANMVDGRNLNRLLKSTKCMQKLNENAVFDLLECENCGFERKHCPIASKYLKSVGNFKEIENDHRSVKFDWVGCIVSQTCSLKCTHCCEHVPSLSDKGFLSVETIVKDVRKIAQSSHFLNYVELIGGEPFLHPEIERLITELLKIENIGYIKSFTNGTVVPSDELCEIMKNPRFMLSVSNYERVANGKLLENIFKTRKKLADLEIKYLFSENFEWLDFSSFDLRDTDVPTLKKGFKDCFISICHRIYKGKLYRCPHQYAGVQLGKLEEFPNECIDLHSFDEVGLSQALERFEDIQFLDACRHCTLPIGANPVPAGEQLRKSETSTLNA